MPRKLSKKDVKNQVKAIMESNTLTEAYMKTHNCSENTAQKHCSDMLKNPDVVVALDKVLEGIAPIHVNKESITKLLTLVVTKWQDGKERTSDFLRALELLSKLVPEFVDRKAIQDYENMDDEALNREISKKLGRISNN